MTRRAGLRALAGRLTDRRLGLEERRTVRFAVFLADTLGRRTRTLELRVDLGLDRLTDRPTLRFILRFGVTASSDFFLPTVLSQSNRPFTSPDVSALARK